MFGCLGKALLRVEGATHFKMEQLEIRAVIKCFCKKGMSSKEIHEDLMETLWKESHYNTVKKWATEFKRERER